MISFLIYFMKLPYWTVSTGVDGKIKSPEDFVVKEIIHKKYFAKYKTSESVKKLEGKYNIFLLRKKNITTHKALSIIAKKFGIRKIGFAGLKDKRAITEQYITMLNGNDFKERNIELIRVGTTDRMLSKGDLIGNEFTITIHDCKTENLPKIVEEINKRGLPNYFGHQRFGIYQNNHVIGKLIVKRDFRKALEMTNKQYGKNYKDISEVGKEKLKFFVNAYQSFLFNKMLAGYVKKQNYFRGFLPLVGYYTKDASIIKQISMTRKNFRINELKFSVKGGKRKAFIKTSIAYTIIGNRAKLRFILPAGSYASVVLREVCKHD